MEKVISVKECMEMCDSDVEFMKEMIVLTREDLIECSHIVSNAYNCNDTMGLRNVAHRVKGEAATIAAKSLTEAAKRVEDSANDPVPANIELLKPLLSNKMKQLSKTYVMPDWLQTKFYDLESQRHRLS